jgi:hypothetical protein
VPLPGQYNLSRGDDLALAGNLSGGWTDIPSATIHLGPSENRHTTRLDQFPLAHEMAHLLDAQSMDDAWRRRFQRIMGLPAGEWHTGTGPTPEGLKSPSERFADYYAAEAVRLRPNEGVGTYEQNFKPLRLRRFGRALEEFGATQPQLKRYRQKAIRNLLEGR